MNIKTNCPNYILETHELALIVSLSRLVGQDRNCHR